jgi:membrane associated rhomboid family serine protease
MLLPISSDAPIYYWPFATVGLIVANVAAYVVAWQMIMADEMAAQWWVMMHGEGLTPLQWFTSMFMHGGFMHLAGNMVFLWVFGLVVEGKLGWWKFLACYLGIGVLQSAVEQVLFLGVSEPSGSYGASSAIYGIMLMAVIWAPRNEVTCLLLIRFVPGTIEIPIAFLAALYLGFDMLHVMLGYMNSGSLMGTGFLHAMGAFLGAGVGIALVKTDAVDCEGWDIFSAWDDNKRGKAKKIKRNTHADRELADKQQAKQQQHLADAKQQIGTFVANGNFNAALRLWTRMKEGGNPLELDREQLVPLVRGLQSSGEAASSAPLLRDLIARFPQAADPARLQLAQLCVTKLEKPSQAIELLKNIDFSQLPPERLALGKKILKRAKQLQAEGMYELDETS